MSLPNVTDRALLRYFERVLGLDVEATRRHVALICADAMKAGAVSLVKDHHIYKFKGQHVVTVMPTGPKAGTPKLSVQRIRGRAG